MLRRTLTRPPFCKPSRLPYAHKISLRCGGEIGTMAAPVCMRHWEGSCMKGKRIFTNARVSGRASLCSLDISGSRCRMDSNPRDADVFCNIIKNVSFLKSQKGVCVCVCETVWRKQKWKSAIFLHLPQLDQLVLKALPSLQSRIQYSKRVISLYIYVIESIRLKCTMNCECNKGWNGGPKYACTLVLYRTIEW